MFFNLSDLKIKSLSILKSLVLKIKSKGESKIEKCIDTNNCENKMKKRKSEAEITGFAMGTYNFLGTVWTFIVAGEVCS